jgi:uncharacterized protein (TIGR03000 family)
MFSSLGLAAVSLFVLLLLADPAAAQPRRAFRYDGGYRGYWGSYSPYWSYGRWGYYGPSWANYYGYGWAYPYGYSYGWSSPYLYSGWYSDWPGMYNFYADAFTYPGVYFYGTNYAPFYSYGVVTGKSATGSAPADTADSGFAYGTTNNSPDAVLIKVKVPRDAEIWFGRFKTTQTGSERRFITPSLQPNRDFSYEVRARWMEGDRPVDQTRKVTVHASQQLTVDFTIPPAGTNARPVTRGEDIAAPKPGDQNPLTARNEDDRSARTKKHDGQVVRISNRELVMKGSDGKEHTHTLASDTRVTIDGKPGKPEDLKPNMKIEVTTPEGDAKTVLRIEAKSSE